MLGAYLRDVMKLNAESRTSAWWVRTKPRPTAWNALFEVTNRMFDGRDSSQRRSLSRDGRVMEVLSEHMCQGWLEGYLLTGRHGFFSCYEAFIHIVDSMFNQHAKWLKSSHATSPGGGPSRR